MATNSIARAGSIVGARLAAVPANVVALGAAGAFLGGIAATAENSYKVAKGELKGIEAAKNVAQETVGTGLSTAAGAAVMTVLGLGGIAGLAGLVVVASLTKGAWDQALDKRSPPPVKGEG